MHAYRPTYTYRYVHTYNRYQHIDYTYVTCFIALMVGHLVKRCIISNACMRVTLSVSGRGGIISCHDGSAAPSGMCVAPTSPIGGSRARVCVRIEGPLGFYAWTALIDWLKNDLQLNGQQQHSRYVGATCRYLARMTCVV